MRVLRLIEKILFVLSVAVIAAAIGLSMLFDELATSPATGIVSSLIPFLTLGAGFILLFLILGAFLRFSKNEVAARIGDALTLAAVIAAAGVGLAVVAANAMGTGFTPLLAFIGGIVYVLDAIMRGIILIVKHVNPDEEGDSPEADRRIQNLLKWKALLDQGIITKEEYEEKRIKILGLNKPVKK